MHSLRLLLSAYACEPGKGSEPGVGWRWAHECAALGHEVWVLTRENNREAIERSLAAHPARNLHFLYYDLPRWARWWKKGRHSVHLYYLLWQLGAYRHARAAHAEHRFDAVHHITFGVTRHPSFMGRLGIPFIIGPLGGAERAPQELRRYYPLAGKIKDGLRDVFNWIARYDPWVQRGYAQASLILMKTPESLEWLPERHRDKAVCMMEIGVDRTAADHKPVVPFKTRQSLHILYVGRFIYWKGMDLGLRAVAELRDRNIPVRLTMIGQGPDKERWQALAAQLKLAYCVTWVPWMKQQDLLLAYQTFDTLLFPSLHDSSGNVVLESLAGGLPVVCLNLGGPARLVDATCGRVVGVAGSSADNVVRGLADALAELAADHGLVAELRDGALARSQEYTWRRVVAQVWGEHGDGYRAVVQLAKQDVVYASA